MDVSFLNKSFLSFILLGGCSYEYNDLYFGSTIELPVVLHLGQYEYKGDTELIEGLEWLNERYKYANTSFYLDNVIYGEKLFSLYDHSKKIKEEYWSKSDKEINIFYVDNIIVNDNVYIGFAATDFNNFCKKYFVMDISVMNKNGLIAHELGHLMGLGHSDKDGNIMQKAAAGNEFTTEQLEVIENHASTYQIECVFNEQEGME